MAEQRRVMGRRRVKTDVIDLVAITELLLAGRGVPIGEPAAVIGELSAWVAHRSRRVLTRTATKNQRGRPGTDLQLPQASTAIHQPKSKGRRNAPSRLLDKTYSQLIRRFQIRKEPVMTRSAIPWPSPPMWAEPWNS